ncbi:hypothetical protein LTR78_007773 [Recurvomyces mirabilis]|uniref:Uncharacterized protein n=1 Tax=Recurvomyces mirabilis TaxID=574656 RepID=A0AAE0WI12_9PEZI|nr:hypothetical protein LTR78_007773 [Recurvomyces mirabilis]KAK5151661.1 hypothetical protein LTS14_009148 [Recurvomyces mirabilis]
MGGNSKGDAFIQAFFPPTPNSSPTTASVPSSNPPPGDGFTSDEIAEASRPKPAAPWQPAIEYEESDISDLYPGPKAVTFMGRVCNIFDLANTPKTPRSSKGCVKLCIKDDTGAITLRLWYASARPDLGLGTLVSVWANHVSNGENGSLSSTTAPLFVSLFPERDRSCHLMIHEKSDDGTLCKRPLGHRTGQPLAGLMTLHNFIDGGCDISDARVLVVVKSIGAKERVTRKDESVTENVNVHVQDNTAEATLGLWGSAALSPFGRIADETLTKSDVITREQGWKAGETVLLLQCPGCKLSRTTYLSATSSTLIDLNPRLPDADWLRSWSARQHIRASINPTFPVNPFDLHAIKYGPLRCLYTIADLDEFARAAPKETFQGYLSVLITEVKLLECSKRHMLLCGECCTIPFFANALVGRCKHCESDILLRLNPKLIAQVMDETGVAGTGKLLLSDMAWRELLGRTAEDLLRLGHGAMKDLADRLIFTRVTLLFGWTGDETKAGGRICVLGVRG